MGKKIKSPTLFDTRTARKIAIRVLDAHTHTRAEALFQPAFCEVYCEIQVNDGIVGVESSQNYK